MTNASFGGSIGDAIHLADRGRSDQSSKHTPKSVARESFASLLELSAPADRARAFSETGLFVHVAAPTPHSLPAPHHATQARPFVQSVPDFNAPPSENATLAATPEASDSAAPTQRMADALLIRNTRQPNVPSTISVASTESPSLRSASSNAPNLPDVVVEEPARQAPLPNNSQASEVLVNLESSGVRVVIRTGALDAKRARDLRQNVTSLLNAEGLASASVSYLGAEQASWSKRRY